MKYDADTLERAAFACFGNKLEDNYKRLVFLNIEKIVRENPNITANKCFSLMENVMTITRHDFDCAVGAMEMPFKRFNVNRYTRKVGGPQRKVVHINLGESDLWNLWVESIKTKYPELSLWLS